MIIYHAQRMTYFLLISLSKAIDKQKNWRPDNQFERFPLIIVYNPGGMIPRW